MTAWHPESDDPDEVSAQEDLGGHAYTPTPEQAAAMLRAGLGGVRERAIVARDNAGSTYADEFGLTGQEGNTTGSPAKAMARRAARASGVLAAMLEGHTPTEIAARYAARDGTSVR